MSTITGKTSLNTGRKVNTGYSRVPGQWSGMLPEFNREGSSGGEAGSCRDLGISVVLSPPNLRIGQQGRSPEHAVVWQGRNPRDIPLPGQQSPQAVSLRASGSRRGFGTLMPGRAPPSPFLTHRGLRIPSDKPWPRRSLYPRAGCAGSDTNTTETAASLAQN